MWVDEVASIGAIWRLAAVPRPRWRRVAAARFEFGFGQRAGRRDRDSLREAVTLEGGFNCAAPSTDRRAPPDQGASCDRSQDRTKPDRIEKAIIGGGACCSRCSTRWSSNARSTRRSITAGCSIARPPASFFAHPIPLNESTRTRVSRHCASSIARLRPDSSPQHPTEEACGRCDFIRCADPRGAARRAQTAGRACGSRTRFGAGHERGSFARMTRRAASSATHIDDTLVVEAAAGTGKTTELVNRILAVLPRAAPRSATSLR